MATNRADTLKTALLVIGGSGALAGLYVAYRKQRTDEANHLRDQDKLFTERYTQAVAQLGNTTSAAVRLGGVYALARIADDSERDRPTCLKVLCAYLRMPYHPDKAEPAEREVRTTAQTVLAERLRPNHPGYWPSTDIDLRGAHLIDLDFSYTTIEQLHAQQATFAGDVQFGGATFAGDVQFGGAVFSGDVQFGGAVFSGDVQFGEATFTGIAQFAEATFTGDTLFAGATFTENAWFRRATFTGDTWFNGATFTGIAWFAGASFTENAWFDGARFTRNASFAGTSFTSAPFAGATFSRAFAQSWPEGLAEPSGIKWSPAVEP